MDNDVISTPNNRGNWDVFIPNMGKDDLQIQIDKMEKSLPYDEDIQALIDVLWDVFYSMK